MIEFTTPELQYPDRLNAADRARSTCRRASLGAGPARAADAGRARSGPTASCSDRANQVAQVLAEDLGLVAGQPGAAALAQQPVDGRRLARRPQGRRHRGDHHGRAARPRARARSSSRPGRRSRWSTTGSPRTCAALRPRSLPDARSSPSAATAPDDLTPGPRPSPASSPPWTRPPTTSRCSCPTSGSTGVPKITMHFHRDLLSIDNTFGRHVLRLAAGRPGGLHRAVRVHLRARHARRLPAAGRRLRAADRGGHARAARRRWSRSTASRCSRPPHGVQADAARRARSGSWPGCAPRCQRRRAHAGARPGTGCATSSGCGSSTASAAPSCCTSSSPRPATTSAPGRPAGRCPAAGPRSSAPTATELGAGQPGRLGVIGPVGCRYLDDERQRAYVVNGWNVTGDTFTARRGRLLLLPRPHRQHDRLLRLQHRRPGGRGGHRHPPRRRRVRGGRRARRRARLDRLRVRGAARRRGRRRARRRSEIQDYVKQTLAPYKYPRDVRFVDALPRNTSGKLQHFELRQQLEAETSAETAAGGGPYHEDRDRRRRPRAGSTSPR